MEHTGGESYHNRYAYSTKIICEEHGTSFFRQVLKSSKGEKEVWECKVYRNRGRSACSAPQVRTTELNTIMSKIFQELVKDKKAIVDSLVTVLTNVPKEVDYGKLRSRVEEQIAELHDKKDKILDLNISGVLSVEEFKTRNDAFNAQLSVLETQLAAISEEERSAAATDMDIAEIRRVLNRELDFQDGINSNLVASILDKIVVKKESTRTEIHLEIYLKVGKQYDAAYERNKTSMNIIRLRNTIPRPTTRRT